MKALVLFFFGVFAVASAAFGQTTLYSIGSPTDEEQSYLEFINRARANPGAEGARLAAITDPQVTGNYTFFGVDLALMQTEFNALTALPPLAMNANLTQAARGHSQDMFTNVFQGHVSTNGKQLGARATDAGYAFSSLGENVFSSSSSVSQGHAGFEVDWGPGGAGGMQSGRGHRANIHGSFREVGVGMKLGSNTAGTESVGPQIVTQDFGSQNNNLAYVTGVAFYDLNGNAFFDPGEGIGGVTVNVAGSTFHAITANTGGYAVPVPTANANRAVTFTGLGFNTNAQATITAAKNVKVDLSPVYTAPVVTGPATASTAGPTVYQFTTVNGAVGYDRRHSQRVAVAADGANNLTRVTAVTQGGYSALSTTVRHAGLGAYRLARPAGGEQSVTYTAPFFVLQGGSISFRSRLGFATTQQAAHVQASTDDGLNWTDVIPPQAGTGGAGEASFQLRNASLAAFEGKEVRLRFNYVSGNSFFNQTDDGVGWYVDEVTFTNVLDLSGALVTAVPGAAAQFDFTAPAIGDFLLWVRPNLAGRSLAFGPALSITATAAPVPAVDVTLQQPEGTNLTDGTSAINFGTALVGAQQVRTFKIINSGTDPLNSLALTVDGANAPEFAVSALAQTDLPLVGDSTTFTVTFTPAAGGARTAKLHLASNDPNESPFDVTLNGTGDATPQVTGPASLIRLVGTQASFAVSATPAPTGFQWRKNGATITGATTDTFTINAVKLTDAGAYSALVKNGAVSAPSANAQLGVVENVPKTLVAAAGSTVTLTVNAAGTGITFSWLKNGVPMTLLPTDSRFSGLTGKTLTLKLLTANDTATYACKVFGPIGDVTGATTNLRVFDAAPDILPEPIVFSPAIVSGTYDFTVPISGATNLTPTSFTAKNLPPGLVIDKVTGRITGRPTVIKVGGYEVTIVASNSKGGDEAKGFIQVAKLPDNVAGTYAGLVARHPLLDSTMGGRLTMVIAPTGVVSGSLVLGSAAALPLTGAASVQLDESTGGSLTIKRAGTALPLTLAFTVDRANHRLINATLTDGTSTAVVEGWRQIRNKTSPTAAAYLGLHTFGLRIPAANALATSVDVPQGWGYASIKVAVDGTLTLAGKTADGETITGSTFVGPMGEVALFQPLYTTPVKGSLLGRITIAQNVEAVVADNTISGALDWTRPPGVATARTYKAGFGLVGTPVVSPVPLEAIGGFYAPPVAGSGLQVLGLPAGTNNSQLLFTEGGVEGNAMNAGATVSIGLGSKATTPPLGATNLAGTKITVLTATTGAFSGSFTLADQDPRTNKTLLIKRTVTFQGLIISDGAASFGAGYLLLPKLPTVQNPTALPPILSGQVELRKL